MTPTEILAEMGLTDDEVRTLLGKMVSTANSLDAAQTKAFQATLPSLEEGVESFVGDITEEQLQAFLQERSPPGAAFIIVMRGTHFGGHAAV
jgi:hypothetical protein